MITIGHLVRRIMVHILPTRPHFRSANFGLRFTCWWSARPQVHILHVPKNLIYLTLHIHLYNAYVYVWR